MAEDDEALLSAPIQCHEHVDTCLVLHTTKLTASVACDPALAIHWDVHLSAVFAVGDIGDGDCTMQLLQKPADVLLAALPFLQTASYESESSHKLQDATCRLLNLLLSGGFFPDDVAQLVILDAQPVRVKALVVRKLLTQRACVSSGRLLFNLVHAFELCSSPSALVAKDDEFLTPPLATSLARLLCHEEHQSSPLFLHAAQSRTTTASDVSNAVAWNMNHAAIIAVFPALHVHRSLQLTKQPLHVVLGATSLQLRPREQC
mmetsp:Transcript_36278/g.66453  ORF Transcript_36278/g.66453 Transcript_36278/m.66453 type:complete len:261 (+) Transcript_36278:432-1214(+)